MVFLLNFTKYLKVAVGVIAILIISVLYMKNASLKQQNTTLESKLTNLNVQLQHNFIILKSQNDKITQQKIEIQDYKNKKPEIKKEIVIKYLPAPENSNELQCEDELNLFKNQLKVFNNGTGF